MRAHSHDELNSNAIGLFSQQLWCFGQDVMHPDGNLLLKFGCMRTPAPQAKPNCPSIYTLNLSATKRVLLRGFGVFVSDDSYGGLFIERFGFQPKYTCHSKLPDPPWESEDLPPLREMTSSTYEGCRLLILDLLRWFITYERGIINLYGEQYRDQTLLNWNNGKRWCVLGGEMVASWEKLVIALEQDTWQLCRLPLAPKPAIC